MLKYSLFFALIALGCSGESADSGATGGTSATDSSGGTSSGGSSTSSGGTSSGSVDPDPTLCGGAYESPCAAGNTCVFDTSCGSVGYCIRQRDECATESAPVCGCDGKTYDSECLAIQAGVSKQADGACPEARIPCGDYECVPGKYCLDKGESASPWRYACSALPDACSGTGSCECVGTAAACYGNQSCSVSGDVVTVTCGL